MAEAPRKFLTPKQYTVSYFSRKHRISLDGARAILQQAGRSREKANELVDIIKKKR